mgnify:CR=1 FL=1
MDAHRRDILKKGGGVTLFTLVAAAGWLPPPDVIIRLTIADDAREIECLAASLRGSDYLERCCTPC